MAMEIIGREESVRRLDEAREITKSLPGEVDVSRRGREVGRQDVPTDSKERMGSL